MVQNRHLTLYRCKVISRCYSNPQFCCTSWVVMENHWTRDRLFHARKSLLFIGFPRQWFGSFPAIFFVRRKITTYWNSLNVKAIRRHVMTMNYLLTTVLVTSLFLSLFIARTLFRIFFNIKFCSSIDLLWSVNNMNGF